MSNVQFGNLTAVSSLSTSDQTLAVQGGVAKRMTVQNILDVLSGNTTFNSALVAGLPASLTDATARAALRLNLSVPTRTAMRALTPSATGLYWLGEVGFEGFFRVDASDTTGAADDGVMLIIAGGGARLRRVVAGKVNARWFGMSPDSLDNTAALQAAVTFASTDTREGFSGCAVFIPHGYYRFKFTDGTSGLSTITVSGQQVVIEGEDRGTWLTMSGGTTRVDAFFTFRTSATRAQGWGLKNITIDGRSLTNWAARVDTCRHSSFHNIQGHDLHGGVLDFYDTQGAGAEKLSIRDIDYIPLSGTNSCFPKYGIRFRVGPNGQTWTDSKIDNCLFIGAWYAGVYMDACTRLTFDTITTSGSSTSTNVWDPDTNSSPGSVTSARFGVYCTNTKPNNDGTTVSCGYNVLRAIRLEADGGAERTAPTNGNAVVVIDCADATVFNRYNVVEDPSATAGPGPGVPAIAWVLSSGGSFRTAGTIVRSTRNIIQTDSIYIGAGAIDTVIETLPSSSSAWRIVDAGTDTRINGALFHSFENTTSPSTVPGSGRVEVGDTVFDTASVRVAVIAPDGTSRLIKGEPGTDFVAARGKQLISPMVSPSAPSVKPVGLGVDTSGWNTSYSYQVVSIDAAGNKTNPSTAGTTSTGPSSLTSTTYNHVSWTTDPCAVSYDLLRGDNVTSVATGLKSPSFNDKGASTSVYVPNLASQPPGYLWVNGLCSFGRGAGYNIAAGVAAGTSPGTPTVTGHLHGGYVTIITGTGTPSSGVLATMTYQQTAPSAPKAVLLWPASAATANLTAHVVYVDPANIGTSLWSISVSAALAASTTYVWYYSVVG